ncbi:hypothetical protein [Curtobacterium sp. MCPF17_052]|uniref:hypothetical protein n=1 Tax=Curtobacterium sp. MCPF17_052 TaxID=2175655 RepID=UPI0024E03FE9|nr:hypothetical protein [Curtobacterium sp. MCPF17_052]WIB13310.1 hypothetical protein DEJ36_05545 [Curtobacterium sp. MCPF17_052]
MRYTSIELLTNNSHAQQAIWWHISPSADLFVNTQDDLMHWGEFDTPVHHYLTKLSELQNSRKDSYRYLYSAYLRSGASINPTVFVENQDLDQHGEIEAAYKAHGPTRYLNIRERPGSISLIARKRDFVVHQAFDLWNFAFKGTASLPPDSVENNSLEQQSAG